MHCQLRVSAMKAATIHCPPRHAGGNGSDVHRPARRAGGKSADVHVPVTCMYRLDVPAREAVTCMYERRKPRSPGGNHMLVPRRLGRPRGDLPSLSGSGNVDLYGGAVVERASISGSGSLTQH